MKSDMDFKEVAQKYKIEFSNFKSSRIIQSFGIIYLKHDTALICKKRYSNEFCRLLSGKYSEKVFYEAIRRLSDWELSILQKCDFPKIYKSIFHKYPDSISRDRFDKLRHSLQEIIKTVGRKKTTIYWDFPKGRLMEGESPLTAALREFQEETNIDSFKLRILDKTITYIRKGSDDNLYMNIYFIAVSDEDLTPIYNDNGEIYRFAFVSLDAMHKYMPINKYEISD